jgi:GTPase
LPRTEQLLDVLLPFAEGRLVARMHEYGEVVEEVHTETGTRIRAFLPAWAAAEFADYVVAPA